MTIPGLIRRGFAVVFAATATMGIAAAQPGGAYRNVEPIPLPLDRSGVWTLHFAYTPPRILQVDTPKGKKTVWYMVYQVWNKSDTPQQFVPEFELVTKDGKLQSFLDEPYPGIVKTIRAIEDPTGALKLQTTVGIAGEKIPVTKVDSVARAITGVAVWLDAPDKAAVSNNFSVYVTGLSNGVAVEEKDGAPEKISRKTLQVDFTRPTDNNRPMADDIQPNDNGGKGAARWFYRAVPAAAPATPPPAAGAEKK